MLRDLATALTDRVNGSDGQWVVKGFIDTLRRIYPITSDTKVISKVLEIHILPTILAFAQEHEFSIIPASRQNYYPDLSFLDQEDSSIRFAVDIKTTYRLPKKPWLCNGFTLGSHGAYFTDRSSTKNIEFPYGSYSAHFCLCAIYTRSVEKSDDREPGSVLDLDSIASAITDVKFFATEKWRIAGDRRGSGNTANIGSIQRIEDLTFGRGMFSRLGEDWFDDYWMNYGKITHKKESGDVGRIRSLGDFVDYRGGDPGLIVPRNNEK